MKEDYYLNLLIPEYAYLVKTYSPGDLEILFARQDVLREWCETIIGEQVYPNWQFTDGMDMKNIVPGRSEVLYRGIYIFSELDRSIVKDRFWL